MPEDNFESFNFKISDNYEVLKEVCPMPPALEEKMERLHELARKGKPSGIKILQKEIKRFPKNAELKSLLALLYDTLGEHDKADQLNARIADEHPEYLFGLANQAFVHHENGAYEKMEEVLGKGFNLKTLYPERDEFHIIELIVMQKAAVYFYGAMGDLEQAKIRLDIIEELTPDSEDFKQAQQRYVLDKIKDSPAIQSERDMLKRFFTTQDVETKRPDFNHPIMEELFEHGHDIPQMLIDEIMELPREELIEDLESIIDFSITHFEAVSYEVIPEEKTFYVSHAIYLLADLNAEETLPTVLEVLKQPEEYNEFYFGELVTDITWDPIMRLGLNQVEMLFDFLKVPNLYTYNRVVLFEVLEEIVLHYPEKKAEIYKGYEELLNFYLSSKDESIIDIDVIGLMVWSLMDLRAKQFEPQISAFFDKDYVNTGMVGTKEVVLENLLSDAPLPEPKPLLSLIERYAIFFEHEGLKSFEPIDFNDFSDVENYSSHSSGQSKIQRNDPCPCGSGKKYKKCCLNKN